jgi:hypothetical protein
MTNKLPRDLPVSIMFWEQPRPLHPRHRRRLSCEYFDHTPHPLACPNCDTIVDAFIDANRAPAIVRCDECGYTDLDRDLKKSGADIVVTDIDPRKGRDADDYYKTTISISPTCGFCNRS